jgi:hypothetical protein
LNIKGVDAKMGMFDLIEEFEISCPICGNKVNDFQVKITNNFSKYKYCDLRTGQDILSDCSKCKCFIRITKGLY